MSMPVGGYKQRAWRLKKKWRKAFFHLVCEFVAVAIHDLPKDFFSGAFVNQDYEFMRVFNQEKMT